MKKPLKTANTPKFKFFLIFVLVLLAGFLLFKIYTKDKTDNYKNKIIPQAVKKLVKDSNTKIAIDNIKETSGVVQFDLKLGADDKAQKYTSYITKDGEILFTSGIKLDSLSTTQSPTQAPTKKLTCADLPKSEKASLTAFVVSDCPFGVQMQRVFKKGIEEVPALSSYLNVKYIGSIEKNKITSMHGDKEAQENLRQICIREEQEDKYWPYVSCYMQEGKTDDCLVTSGVNSTQLKACADDVSRGIKYAKADFDLANKFNVGSSPTLLLNEKQTVSEFDFGGRVPNAIKDIICCASKEKPQFCSKDISKEEVAASFSTTDKPSSTGNSGAGCGN